MNWSGLSDESLFGKVPRLPLGLLPAEVQVPIMQGRLKRKKMDSRFIGSPGVGWEAMSSMSDSSSRKRLRGTQ